MKPGIGDYHLVVAQNFLTNVSLDGNYPDVSLRRVRCHLTVEDDTSQNVDGTKCLTMLQDVKNDKPLGIKRNVCTSISEESGDFPGTSSTLPSTNMSKLQKFPLLKKFVRLVSSNDLLLGEKRSIDEGITLKTEIMLEEVKSKRSVASCGQSFNEERTLSPIAVTQFSFLRLIRISLYKGGRSRSYLCAPSGAPLIVVSHFPFQSSARSKSHPDHSVSSIESLEELYQGNTESSIEELRPFDFKEADYVHFEELGSHLRRSSISLSGVPWKSPVRDEKSDLQANQHSCKRLGSLSNARESTDTGASTPDERDSYHLDTGNSRCNDYDPLMLDEVVLATRTVIRTSGFIGITKLFVPAQIEKAMLNERFTEKFPKIHLTYSKLNSIKKDLWELAKDCGVDEYTVAQTFVYYERIAIKGLISKYNRKFVAGTAFLVAVKMNDYKKQVILRVLQSAEDILRISRRDILSFELPFCSALQFDLFPPYHHIEPHLRKLLFKMI